MNKTRASRCISKNCRMYYVPCSCGKRIEVELFQAGTTTQCPACATNVAIPGSTKLKELSGDPYPHLSPFDKLHKTLINHEPPFDGTCHHCGQQPAEYQIPIHFKIVVERHVEDTAPVQLGVTGINLVVAASEEVRRYSDFPLLLYPQCVDEYRAEISREVITRWITWICLVIIAISFLIFLVRRPLLFDLLGKLYWVFAAVIFFVAIRLTAKRKIANNVVGTWVKQIRWASEAIDGEDEFTLSAGKIEPYEPTQTAF